MDPSSSPAKLPIRMRLGLPSGGSSPEEHVMSRRRNRKVKLKRNVMIGSRPDNKVMCCTNVSTSKLLCSLMLLFLSVQLSAVYVENESTILVSNVYVFSLYVLS